MIRTFLIPLLALAAAGCGSEAPLAPKQTTQETAERPQAKAAEPLPDKVRVRLETEAGAIVVELDSRRAPLTTANFVRYAEEGRLDGTSFYRAAPTRGAPERGFIQGGIRRNYRRMLPPVPHEPTSETGLRHVAGAISMARTEPGNAMGEFFITTAAIPAMDADAEDPGYAAFGRVVEGMDIVRKLLAAPVSPTKGAESGMQGQIMEPPVKVLRAARID